MNRNIRMVILNSAAKIHFFFELDVFLLLKCVEFCQICVFFLFFIKNKQH